ncbi:MAG: type IV pilus assembly protein PilM [Gammaproteobacteria bacterium]
MLLKPRKKQPLLLGIDISSSAIKVVEMSASNQGYKIEHYGAEPLASNTMADRAIVDVESIGEAIRRAVRKSGSRLKKAIVAVGGAQIITSTIVLPRDLDEQEMSEQIDLQLDQHMALSRDEVSYDFDVMGPNKSDPTQVDVRLVATRREYVEKRQAALEIAGLSAAIVDIETHALDLASQLLENQMPNSGSQKMVAILDFGATLTTFCLRDNHQMVYTRDQAFGGRMLTEEIMRFYGLSFEEAGLAKRREGLPKSYQKDVLEPFMDEMAKHIRSFYRQYQETSGSNQHLDQIILCGGCSQIPSVADYIGKQLSIPTIRGNPLEGTMLASQPKSARIEQDAPSLMIALGLAMRSFL